MNERIRQLELEDMLRGEFDSTLRVRVDRYMSVRPHPIIPNAHFAPESSECSLLYRDGYFFACIALAQSVAEALVRFVAKSHGWESPKKYEKAVRQVCTRIGLSSELEERLGAIWANRDDYHHLNPSVEQDQKILQAFAKEKLEYLNAIEAEVFAYDVQEGRLHPRYPKLWPPTNQGETNVFLRIDP